MKLRAYIKRLSQPQLAEFAQEVGTTTGHLRNVAYELRSASPALARQVALRTAREVAEWDLRPDDWWLIWPELVDDQHPVPVQQREAA